MQRNVKALAAVSLIEVLIVVAILALLFGISLPTLFRTARSPLYATFQSFSSTLDNARFYSVLYNQPLDMVFDLTEQKVRFLQRKDKREVPALGLFSFDRVRIDSFRLHEQFFTAGLVRIAIEPTGYIQPFQSVWVDGNSRYQFAIKNALGEIVFQPGSF